MFAPLPNQKESSKKEVSDTKSLLNQNLKFIPARLQADLANFTTNISLNHLMNVLEPECGISYERVLIPFILGTENKTIFSLDSILDLLKSSNGKLIHPMTREKYDISDLEAFFETHVHIATAEELQKLIKEKEEAKIALEQAKKNEQESKQPQAEPDSNINNPDYPTSYSDYANPDDDEDNRSSYSF